MVFTLFTTRVDKKAVTRFTSNKIGWFVFHVWNWVAVLNWWNIVFFVKKTRAIKEPWRTSCTCSWKNETFLVLLNAALHGQLFLNERFFGQLLSKIVVAGWILIQFEVSCDFSKVIANIQLMTTKNTNKHEREQQKIIPTMRLHALLVSFAVWFIFFVFLFLAARINHLISILAPDIIISKLSQCDQGPKDHHCNQVKCLTLYRKRLLAIICRRYFKTKFTKLVALFTVYVCCRAANREFYDNKILWNHQ